MHQVMTLNTGDMVVFDTMCYHNGTSNISQRARMLLSFSFLADRSTLNMNGFTYLVSSDIEARHYRVKDLLFD